MPNLAAIYTDHSRLTSDEKPEPKQEEDIASVTMRRHWLTSEFTTELIKKNNERITILLQECLNLAGKTGLPGRGDVIINKLIEVNAIVKQLETYQTLNKA